MVQLGFSLGLQGTDEKRSHKLFRQSWKHLLNKVSVDTKHVLKNSGFVLSKIKTLACNHSSDPGRKTGTYTHIMTT